jgi:hypothetical protein
MPEFEHREQEVDDQSALDAIAELFRLPEWRINDSRVAFLRSVADVVAGVRDLSVPASPRVLHDHGWILKSIESDEFYYDDLYEWRTMGEECDFCDRRFYPDESGQIHGVSHAFRDDPDDPDSVAMQTICELCKAERPPGMWPEQLKE